MIGIRCLSFPKELQEQFIAEVSHAVGEEVCAVLVGTAGNFSGQVKEVRMIKNIAENPRRIFTMDPVQFLTAIEDTTLYEDNAPEDYLGIIHSHENDRAYPSITDWWGAAEKGLYHGPYLIYSVRFHQFNAFYWNGNEFIKMELVG